MFELFCFLLIGLLAFFLSYGLDAVIKFFHYRKMKKTKDDVIMECRNPLCESHKSELLPAVHERLIASGSMELGFNLQCRTCGYKSEARYEGKAC